jgi:uroporphyrinogen-III decarboxylase
VLPFGAPQEVRDQVAERIRIFAKGGGFVFNTIHNIQAKTPIDNLMTMFNTINAVRGLPAAKAAA